MPAKEKQSVYDVIVIGSSPISMIEAIYCAEQGQNTLILEKTDNIGGMWGIMRTEALEDIDVGCHIIAKKKSAYDLIEKYSGCKMVKMDPQPVAMIAGVKVKYESPAYYAIMTLQSGLRILGVVFQNIASFLSLRSKQSEDQTIRQEIRNTVTQLTNVKDAAVAEEKNFLYPEGGTKSLIDNFVKRLEQSRVNVQKNSDVQKVAYHNDLVSIETTNGDQYTCHRLVIPTGINLETIHFDEDVKIDYNNFAFPHLLFVLKDPNRSAEQFTYVHLSDSTMIDRVNDYTNYITGLDDDCHALMVLMKPDYDQSTTSHSDILNELRRFKLITTEAQIQNTHFYDYKVTHITKDIMNRINEFSDGKIEVIDSRNLAYCLDNNKTKWAA